MLVGFRRVRTAKYESNELCGEHTIQAITTLERCSLQERHPKSQTGGAGGCKTSSPEARERECTGKGASPEPARQQNAK